MIAAKLSSVQKRKLRVRRHIKSVSVGQIRLTVHRSNQHTYAQVIDDSNSRTLVSASTLEQDFRANNKSLSSKKAAEKIGELIAKRAMEKGIKSVVFDRGQFLYHGRVKALAEGARNKGLQF